MDCSGGGGYPCKILYFYYLVGWFWDHIQQGSNLIPGSLLRDHFWQCSGDCLKCGTWEYLVSAPSLEQALLPPVDLESSRGFKLSDRAAGSEAQF